MKSLDEMDRDDRIDWIVDTLKNGETYTANDLAEDLDVSASTVHGYMDEIQDRGYPVATGHTSEGAKEYGMAVDLSVREKPELHTVEEQADYLTAEATGTNATLNNEAWEEKETVKILALSELGLGTKFTNDTMWDGLAYKLEEKADGDEDYFDENFAAVVNGGLLPRVPKWSYKTARQYQRALGTHDDKEPNATAARLADKEALRDIVDEELLPDDEAEAEQYLDELIEQVDAQIDLEENRQKITNLQEATEVAQQKIDQLYDATGIEFDLYIHQGEQDEANIEDLEEMKIQELSEEQKERMEDLQNKITERNKTLQQLKDQLEEEYGDEYSDAKQVIDRHLEGDERPEDLDLEDLDLDDEFDLYQAALDEQEDLLKTIRETELNLNAMMVDRALGEYADVFNRKYLEADQAEITRLLAELEYNEYLHQVGNVEDIATEPELLRFDVGGYTVDLAHSLNIASDEPLKYGYKREMEKYKNRTDGDADLFLTGHHGEYKAQQFVHGRGEDANDHTWVVGLSTFMDEELLEEFGEDQGLHLIKDVKRKNKGLFDSTVSLIELTVEEGPDGELRKRFSIEGWDGDYLKNLGRQLNGEEFPGTDFTDVEMTSIAARGDDQIGAPHGMEYLYEPMQDEVIAEDMHNVERWMDETEGDAILIDVGDTFQGNDIFPDQKTEGSIYRGDALDNLRETLVDKLEAADVDEDKVEAVKYYLEDRNVAQEPITGLGEQADLVQEWVAEPYEELLNEFDDLGIILTDGNHYNNNAEGMSEAKRIKQMLDADVQDRVLTATGNSDGDGTFTFGDLQVRVKHRPTGYGRNPISKMLNQSLEQDTDVFVGGHLHVPSFGKKRDVLAMMPGSAQATNKYVKGFTDAPAERGAVFLETASDPAKKSFRFEHVANKGMNNKLKGDG